MPTLEDIAQHIMKVAADPARLQAEAERIPDTAFTTAQAGCSSIDERLVLFSKCFGTEALPSYIRVNRRDAASLKRAAEDLDRNRLGDLAAIVRATIPTVKLKVSAAVTAKKQARKAAKRAYLKALAKAR
jgi:hypothetical protein